MYNPLKRKIDLVSSILSIAVGTFFLFYCLYFILNIDGSAYSYYYEYSNDGKILTAKPKNDTTPLAFLIFIFSEPLLLSIFLCKKPTENTSSLNFRKKIDVLLLVSLFLLSIAIVLLSFKNEGAAAIFLLLPVPVLILKIVAFCLKTEKHPSSTEYLQKINSLNVEKTIETIKYLRDLELLSNEQCTDAIEKLVQFYVK